MRDYGKIRTRIWGDDKVIRLSDRGKLLFLYLQTCTHSNGIGCYRLPSGYIESDLGWGSRTVTDTLAELLRERLIERCDLTGWTFIRNFMKHNSIDNPNTAKAMIPFIEAVPENLPFYQQFIESLEPYAKRFEDGYLNGMANRMPNREPNLTQPNHNPTITKPSLSVRARETSSAEPSMFEQFWQAFPRQRRGDRDKALTAYRKALAKTTEDKIHAAVIRYASSRDVAQGFAAGAAAWLNNAGYDNNPVPASAKPADGLTDYERGLLGAVAGFGANA